MAATDSPHGPGGSAVSARGALGAEATRELLDGADVHCEIFPHEPTYRAVEEARAMSIPADREGKTIVLKQGGGFLIAVLPASRRLDLGKVRRLLEDPSIRLAQEGEIATSFPRFEVGATPPVGPLVAVSQLIDRSLLEETRIACSAGDHGHGLLVSPEHLVRLGSRPADICED